MASTSTSQQAGLLPSVLRSLRKRRRKLVLADSTGAELTGSTTLVRALALRSVLRRDFLSDDETTVGVLLPPTVAGVVVNLTLALDHRVSVNLNFMRGAEALMECLQLAGIRHVITSRKVLDRLDLELDCDLIILEDLATSVSRSDKLKAAAQGMVMPVSLLERKLGLAEIGADDLLTILFTSGSTGEPKGAMISHNNIDSNCVATVEGISIRSDDVLLGTLPFFHAFGLMATIWMPLVSEAAVAFHTSPLEPAMIAEVTRKYHATVLLSTPTFLRLYVARVDEADFASLTAVVTGAEKLPVETADRFERKFGLRPFEGYGVTETSPVVSFNVPPDRAGDRLEPLIRPGTVGKPIPGITVRVCDRVDGNVLATGADGSLHVAGPNVMLGYLNRPDLTARVIQDGWYNTGDIARIDDDGFITITGRESQFSKIGGEMVPHLLIEEKIVDLLGSEDEGLVAAVTAVPDKRKGERLVVIHVPLPIAPDQISDELRREGLPPLYIPSPDSYVEVPAIPALPTGKIDLRQVRNLAALAFDEDGNRVPSVTSSG